MQIRPRERGAKAIENACNEMYRNLDTKEGEKRVASGGQTKELSRRGCAVG